MTDPRRRRGGHRNIDSRNAVQAGGSGDAREFTGSLPGHDGSPSSSAPFYKQVASGLCLPEDQSHSVLLGAAAGAVVGAGAGAMAAGTLGAAGGALGGGLLGAGVQSWRNAEQATAQHNEALAVIQQHSDRAMQGNKFTVSGALTELAIAVSRHPEQAPAVMVMMRQIDGHLKTAKPAQADEAALWNHLAQDVRDSALESHCRHAPEFEPVL